MGRIMKLSEVVSIYSTQLTKNGRKKRRKGSEWTRALIKYLVDNFGWTGNGSFDTYESPNANVSLEYYYSTITMYSAGGMWEISFSMEDSKEIELDKPNRLLILDNNMAIKL
jgi:hypothetical protein